MATITPVTIDIDGFTITGLRCQTGTRHKILASHGWLDNANSFKPLMPLLQDADIVAIDLPGHGHSSRLGTGAQYHLLDMPWQWLQIASVLGWPTFHFMGHSLSGGVAPFIATAQPDRLRSIIMLEATGPLSEAADQLPQRVQKAVEDRTNHTRFESRVLDSIDAGVKARMRASKMSEPAARLIVERQLTEHEGGYVWRHDPKHRMASMIYLMEEQVCEVLRAIPCQTLIVTAENGNPQRRRETNHRLTCIPHLTHINVPGDHHMHMDDPKPTATAINAFLKNQNTWTPTN